MPKYNKNELAQKAKELHAVRDTLEKVYRLRDILRFFDSSELLKNSMALKGGTAINLLFFDLPRLSVDIDLDFCLTVSREDMMEQREKIKTQIQKHMAAEGYTQSPKSKFPHSLDSFVFDYVNSAGMKDNLKIEINYSLRSHVLPTRRIGLQPNIADGDFRVTVVDPIEIYATKTVALMTRAAARDLYDLNYMVRYSLFDESELEIYRRCVVFYLAVATEIPPKALDFEPIKNITQHKIVTDLYPVIRDKNSFELSVAIKTVVDFLTENLRLTEKDLEFYSKFRKGYYRPELIFDDPETLERVKEHPMATWKTNKNLDMDAR